MREAAIRLQKLCQEHEQMQRGESNDAAGTKKTLQLRKEPAFHADNCGGAGVCSGVWAASQTGIRGTGHLDRTSFYKRNSTRQTRRLTDRLHHTVSP